MKENKFYLNEYKDEIIFYLEKEYSQFTITKINDKGFKYGTKPYLLVECYENGKKECFPMLNILELGDAVKNLHYDKLILRLSEYSEKERFSKFDIELTITYNIGFKPNSFDEIYSCIRNLETKELKSIYLICNYKGIKKDEDYEKIEDKYHFLTQTASDYFCKNNFENMRLFASKFNLNENINCNEILKFLLIKSGDENIKNLNINVE